MFSPQEELKDMWAQRMWGGGVFGLSYHYKWMCDNTALCQSVQPVSLRDTPHHMKTISSPCCKNQFWFIKSSTYCIRIPLQCDCGCLDIIVDMCGKPTNHTFLTLLFFVFTSNLSNIGSLEFKETSDSQSNLVKFDFQKNAKNYERKNVIHMQLSRLDIKDGNILVSSMGR